MSKAPCPDNDAESGQVMIGLLALGLGSTVLAIAVLLLIGWSLLEALLVALPVGWGAIGLGALRQAPLPIGPAPKQTAPPLHPSQTHTDR